MTKFPKPLEQMTDEEIAIFFRLQSEIEKKHAHAKTLDGYRQARRIAAKNMTSMRREDKHLKDLLDKLSKFIDGNKIISKLYIPCYDDGDGVCLSLQDFFDTASSRKQQLVEDIVLKTQEIERLDRKIKELKNTP